MIGIFSRREIISVAQGKGAWRPPPWVGMCGGKPARWRNDVRRDGGVPRGTERQTIEHGFLDNRQKQYTNVTN